MLPAVRQMERVVELLACRRCCREAVTPLVHRGSVRRDTDCTPRVCLCVFVNLKRYFACYPPLTTHPDSDLHKHVMRQGCESVTVIVFLCLRSRTITKWLCEDVFCGVTLSPFG